MDFNAGRYLVTSSTPSKLMVLGWNSDVHALQGVAGYDCQCGKWAINGWWEGKTFPSFHMEELVIIFRRSDSQTTLWSFSHWIPEYARGAFFCWVFVEPCLSLQTPKEMNRTTISLNEPSIGLILPTSICSSPISSIIAERLHSPSLFGEVSIPRDSYLRFKLSLQL